MIYSGTLLTDAPPYTEGTEPIPFTVQSVGSLVQGFNFTDEYLTAGSSITLVRDMFQRLVYTNAEQESVTTAQLGHIEEVVVSSPYRKYVPIFTPIDANGNFIAWEKRQINPFYLHSLSTGTVRLDDKKYAPIQSTFNGGEEYINNSGRLARRERGELRFNRAGRPLYLLGRKILPDDRFFARHMEFFLSMNAEGRNAFLVDIWSDSPFLFVYQDGRLCNFDIKPIPFVGVFPEEWELTTDFSQAQLNYDFCVVPEAADGECFVRGEQICFRRRVSFIKVPVYSPTGSITSDAPQWAGYTYYEAIPYPEYNVPLRGQGNTESYLFKEFPTHVENAEEDEDALRYARLKMVPDTGLPALHSEERVCRLCDYAPSRGVFYKIDEDGVRYPIMVTPDTSDGYGIATATAHYNYDEITHLCDEVIEHPIHRIVRQDTELLLKLEHDCWRQCAKIDGTIPPDLGDPRALPKRIIFIEPHPDVTGLLPEPLSLASGSIFYLT